MQSALAQQVALFEDAPDRSEPRSIFFLREANVSAVSCLGTAASATETPRIQAVKTYPNQLRYPVEPRIHEGTASRAEVVLFPPSWNSRARSTASSSERKIPHG